jgi:hypothetical protein
MGYCSNCGAPIEPANAKFCGKCGAQLNLTQTQAAQPTYSMPPPPPPPPDYQQPTPTPNYTPQQRSFEQVLGVVLLRKPKSMGRYDAFTGIATTQRIIFAQMTAEMIKNAVQTARDQAKAEGKGFFGQWSEQLKASFSYSQRYLTMDPNAALAETPGNFAIPHDAIREVKLKLKNINKGSDNDIHEFEIEFISVQGQYSFRTDERNETVQLLKQTYGERLKMPFGYFSHGVNIRL